MAQDKTPPATETEREIDAVDLEILRLIDRLSCTVTLAGADIPMPDTRVTEDANAALAALRQSGVIAGETDGY